jgi:hypothetical protein
LDVCKIQWCFFPFFSQRFFIVSWKFLYVWFLLHRKYQLFTTLSLNKDVMLFHHMDL